MSSLHFLMIVGRCPQAREAAKNPDISMSSFSSNIFGIWIGSVSMKNPICNIPNIFRRVIVLFLDGS